MKIFKRIEEYTDGCNAAIVLILIISSQDTSKRLQYNCIAFYREDVQQTVGQTVGL